jgi:hypothetical protein
VARQIKLISARLQTLERSHVRGHRAIGRGDDGRRPPHHVVARKQDALILKRERQMVGGVPGRGDDTDHAALRLNAVAIAKHAVWHIVAVAAGIEHIVLAIGQGAERRVRRAAHDRRSGERSNLGSQRRMVGMGVGDEHRLDRPPADRLQETLQMRLIIRAGIDDRQRMVADQIAVGAVESEWPRIGRCQPPDRGLVKNPDQIAIMRFEGGDEIHDRPSIHDRMRSQRGVFGRLARENRYPFRTCATSTPTLCCGGWRVWLVLCTQNGLRGQPDSRNTTSEGSSCRP